MLKLVSNINTSAVVLSKGVHVLKCNNMDYMLLYTTKVLSSLSADRD